MSLKSKELKSRVASFRVPQRVDDDIEKDLAAHPIMGGVGSANQFYRKLALDWHAGRLQYKVAAHRDMNSDLISAQEATEALLSAPPAKTQD